MSDSKGLDGWIREVPCPQDLERQLYSQMIKIQYKGYSRNIMSNSWNTGEEVPEGIGASWKSDN